MLEEDLHLEKAPIVEALIAIDVGPPLSDQTMSRINDAAAALQGDYPGSEPFGQVQFQFGIDVRAGFVPQQSAQQDASFGRKYVSHDKRQLVVFRRTGFSFSRLPPYQRWESFQGEAKRLWGVYRSAAGPVSIIRFVLRYINRVDIPIGKPVSDFLNLYPEVPSNPDGSPRSINSSYMRVDSMITEIPAARLVIQQAALPPQREGFATLSLDFEVIVATSTGMTEEYIWDKLEVARRIKNQIFVDSLTPKFLEEFR